AWAYRVLNKLGEDAFLAYCHGYSKYSLLENEIVDLLKPELNLLNYGKKVITGKKWYKPDFKLTDNIYMNVDGLVWHSEIYKDPHYHMKMREDFNGSGLELLQFRADEIYEKPDIVKSIILNKLGLSEHKVNGRACEVKELDIT